ncbi:PilN domain-containing protein [Dyella caseinilytica]|uniref:PilN domain-containing protein n=1 Tax=Dyella caseinilytica TaxID=1849581 RepID=A0ABX7GS65_9GAMM|nr:PilN domain-containing protein [Dyella caseinilytica]QRN53284.1 PilN domain-containing protein [Dyella caseinilytica]GGA12880.1 type II secretion system protein L [Dyella caseinilytica]
MNSATQTLRPQLERARRAWRGSPLPGFLDWWGGELRALLPTRWQTLFSGGNVWCLLRHEDGQWRARCSGQPQTTAPWSDALDAPTQQAMLSTAVAGVDRQDLRLALCLPQEAVLRRRLLLPEAARDNLRQIGAFEMDRQTPFRPDQVYYDLRELPGPAPAGRIAAELVAVPRAAVDAKLEHLRNAGIAIDAVDLCEADKRLGVNLLPPEMARVHSDPRRRLNLILAGSAVLLLLLCLGQWLHNHQDALTDMQAQVDAMHGDAQKVSLLRKQLEDSAGASGFLARRKTESVAVVDVLQDLTTRIPEDTWLERFTVDSSGHVGMQGQSAKASSLIDVLQNSKLLTGANFQGVIQRDPATNKERFFMDAQLQKPGKAKPASSSSAGAAR